MHSTEWKLISTGFFANCCRKIHVKDWWNEEFYTDAAFRQFERILNPYVNRKSSRNVINFLELVWMQFYLSQQKIFIQIILLSKKRRLTLIMICLHMCNSSKINCTIWMSIFISIPPFEYQQVQSFMYCHIHKELLCKKDLYIVLQQCIWMRI